jgi:hypothetical protein
MVRMHERPGIRVENANRPGRTSVDAAITELKSDPRFW